MTYHLIQNETEAWDLAQEAFIKAWRALPNFKLDAGLLHLALPYRPQCEL
jgi:DNA-directed RNA polymerase specialized sigma24 family protein